MAIEKKLIHFKKWSDFSSKKLSANEQNTQYTLGVDGALTTGAPDILYQSVCWIKDVKKMWTHGTLYDCSGGGNNIYRFTLSDSASGTLSEEEFNKMAEADIIIETTFGLVSEFKFLYDGEGIISFASLTNNFTINVSIYNYEYNAIITENFIPLVTEETVSDWGFTKNDGTVKAVNIAGTNYTPGDSGIIDLNQAGLYRKPSTGIPNSDLSEELREKLDTAHRNAEAYKGTVTNIIINGETKSPNDGIVDLGNIPTSIPTEVYIADFTMESLRNGMNNGGQVNCDMQALITAMNANKVILVREGEDSAYKGVHVLNGYAEDLLYFSIVDTSGSILWCDGTALTDAYIDGRTLYLRSLDDKQDALKSGENIKTINGESIVGSGNIEISGGTITEVKANGTSIATSGVADIPAASTSKFGVTKLTTLTNSSSTTLAATASAVKSAYDLAASKASMSDVNTAIANAITNVINASY